MTPDWVLALISGSGAAAVAVAWPVTQFVRSRKSEMQAAAAARTAESVADVLAAASALTTALATTRWRYPGHEVMEVPAAIMRFTGRELAEHPAITLWLLNEMDTLSAPLHDLSRVTLTGRSFAAKQEIVEALAHMTGELLLWHQGVRPAEHFEQENLQRPPTD